GAPVKRIDRDGERWVARAKAEELSAPHVLLNMLPRDAASLAGLEHPTLAKLGARVATGWSAGVLFRTVRPPKDAGPKARHIELVADPDEPFLDGNHVFLSIGAEGEGVVNPSLRRMTVSTHIDPARLHGASGEDQRAYVDAVHTRMRRAIA